MALPCEIGTSVLEMDHAVSEMKCLEMSRDMGVGVVRRWEKGRGKGEREREGEGRG